MPDLETLYPGRFMKKEALPAPKVIRITKVTQVTLEGDKGDELKATIHYRDHEGDGEIVWCKTNAKLTAAALDERDYTKWPGHLLTIYHDPRVRFGGKTVGGIRVFGSPEMKAPKRIEIEMPRRKKPEVYELVPTTNKGAPKTANSAPEPAPPAVDEPMPEREEPGTDG
jgi:hypothetical protein